MTRSGSPWAENSKRNRPPFARAVAMASATCSATAATKPLSVG